MTKTKENKLDKIFSLKVRARNKCEWCGVANNAQFQTAHIFGRKFRHTRWDLNNALCLCAGCHHKAHDRPTEFSDFIISKMGRQEYNKLKLKSYLVSAGTDRVNYEDILKELI